MSEPLSGAKDFDLKAKSHVHVLHRLPNITSPPPTYLTLRLPAQSVGTQGRCWIYPFWGWERSETGRRGGDKQVSRHPDIEQRMFHEFFYRLKTGKLRRLALDQKHSQTNSTWSDTAVELVPRILRYSQSSKGHERTEKTRR